MKKVSSILIAILFLLTVTCADVFARGGSSSSSSSSASFSGGRSSSYSSGSFSSSRSSSYSSPSRSYSSPSFSGSGSKNSSSAFSGSGSKSGASQFSGATASQSKPSVKSSYDSKAQSAASRESSAAKFQVYNAANSKTTVSNAGSSIPISQNTRDARMGTVYNNYKPSGYYTPSNTTTVIYRDNYSTNFLQYATMLWMFHHWNDVDKSRFDKQKLAELELKVKQMEAQGIQRDPNYVQPGVDKDLQYSKVSYEKEDEGLGFFGWMLIILGCGLILAAIIAFVMRRY